MSTDQVEDDGVRYCVTAIVDLQGFSNHLEVGGSDLRTTIGLEAVKRLDLLDRSRSLIATEQAASPEAYPETLHSIRINDAIIFTLDLPDIFKPPVGATVRRGLSPNDVGRLFELDQLPDENAFMEAYKTKLANDVRELWLFVGILARLHLFINRIESDHHFPGARTVLATGYRRLVSTQRPEDFLSANFSFSNAYLAERDLHGPAFYVDDHVVRLICGTPFSRNVVRFAGYLTTQPHFDPDDDLEDLFQAKTASSKTTPVQVRLFRKVFDFRQLDPFPLAHLQLLPRLLKYLERSEEPAQGGRAVGSVVRRTFTAIREGPRTLEDGALAHSFTGLRFDLEDDVRVFCEIIESGTSATLENRLNAERRSALINGTTSGYSRALDPSRVHPEGPRV